MRAAVVLLSIGLMACSKHPATQDQLAAAVTSCGIKQADIRNDDDGNAAWFWSYQDGVFDDDLTCVRERLSDEGVAASFYDRSVTDKAN